MKFDEFSLIRYVTEHHRVDSLGKERVEVGIGDDAAVIHWPAGTRPVVSCDTMVDQIHFSPQTMTAHAVGYKAMASAISDIAAMGAKARFATVALIVAAHTSASWLREMYEGLYQCAAQFEVVIVGGDTVATKGDTAISVTVIGELEAHIRPMLRAHATVGDVVFVTGSLGLSAAGLHLLLQQEKRMDEWTDLIQAHRYPQPQCKAATCFSELNTVHALNDISDGLASEAWEIAEASNVSIVLQEANLPLHESLLSYAESSHSDPLQWMLYGGEDYQLLGTVAPEHWPTLQKRAADSGLHLTAIGEVGDGPAALLLHTRSGELRQVGKRGYNHFAENME